LHRFQTQIYKTELSDVQEFENDAKQLKEKIQERINKINDILPQIKGELSAREMRQALILEKLIHNPTLFTDDGRPYRNQWTPRHTNPIQLIEVQGNDMLTIHFKTLVREDIVDFIKRQSGASSIKLNTPNMLSLSIIHLHQLNESILHPEHSLTPNLTYNYLALEDLEILKSAYGEGNGAALLSLISEYHKEQNQISCLKHVEDQIIKLTATASDKGFGMHVLKKFHFDAFQRLSSLINQSTRLNRAFSGALKLDRASIFIDVLQTAISQNKTHSPSFIYFLESCNNRSTRASNFTQALTESNALLKEANKTIQQWFSHKSSQFEKIPRKAATLRKDHAFFQLEQEQVNESMPNHEIKCES